MSWLPDGKSFPKSVPEAKKLIGKRIIYLRNRDLERSRGIYFPQRGTVEAVKGREILISGNWEYLPQMFEYKEEENVKPTE